MSSNVIHRSFAIERRYDCTPQQTFSAFADPALKRRWFGNPGDSPGAEWELDFRVGGHERSSGSGPDGASYAFRSRYHDIVAGERIVFAYDLLLDDRLVSVSLTTIELLPDGSGTRLLFTEQGAFLDGLDDPAGREHGTGSLLDGLGALLAAEWPR
jgi:uncharacterized protein YndB with AHSA1/START domain